MVPSRLGTVLFLSLTVAACADHAPRGARGVILITCDTLRADHLGCYGFPSGTSPRLDQLAGESLLFESAWSTAPLTGPALSALFTGRLPSELGLEDNRTLLSGEALTLPEVLGAHGIACSAVVSNWVLRKRPELPDAGVQQGFASFDDRMETIEPNRPDLRERLAGDTTDAALRWLDARPGERPFFLWVHYQDPHGPYTPPDDCLAPASEEPGDEPELALGSDQRGLGTLPKYQVVADERHPALYRRRYEAEIRYFDRELGRLLDHLRAGGLLDEVLLVFTADHGESLGERGYFFSHGQHLHQEVVRVPLLLRPPGGAAPRRVRTPVSHLDLWPTVLAAMGLSPGEAHGVDLLAGEPAADRVLPQNLREDWSVTRADQRLIVEAGRGPRLYDLRGDPREELDLAPRNPELVQELTRRHRDFLQGLGARALRAAQPELDERSEKELDALGYGGGEEH